MKLKALIIIPLVFAAISYAGIKGYIYYKIKSELGHAIQQALPVLQIDYGDISSDLNGMVSINRISLTPTGTYDEIRIRQLVISGDGPGFLFDLAHGFKQDQPPAQLEIRFDQLESPVSSAFLTGLTTRLGQKQPVAWNTKSNVCSLAGILKGSGLKELGFPGITINGSMGYNYDQQGGVAQIKFNYELAGVETSRIGLELNGLTAAGIMGLGSPPAISKLNLQRTMEPGYIKQMITMCSGKTATNPDRFIDSLVTRSDQHYLNTMGFIPGSGLKQMFKQLLAKPGILQIQAEPSSNIDQATLSAYRASDLVHLLGLSVSHNNQQVTDLSFQTQIKPSASRTPLRTGPLDSSPARATHQKPTPRSRPKLRYIETDIAKLSDYLHYRVRIYTLDNDKPKQGVLISIRNQTINVEQVLYSGKMTAHLHTGRIARIEVLRREQ